MSELFLYACAVVTIFYGIASIAMAIKGSFGNVKAMPGVGLLYLLMGICPLVAGAYMLATL